jgi:hypothetical protein
VTDYYTRRIDYSSYTDAMRGYDFHKDFNVTFEVLKKIYVVYTYHAFTVNMRYHLDQNYEGTQLWTDTVVDDITNRK